MAGLAHPAREQRYSVVRDSLICARVLSSSCEFEVLALNSTGDGFLVLISLSLPANVMPDEYLLERWAAFRKALQSPALPVHHMDSPAAERHITESEVNSGFSELSEPSTASSDRAGAALVSGRRSAPG